MKTLSINQLISSDLHNPYPVLEISESALFYNYNLIKKLTGKHVKTLIPVKANAYGVGLEQLVSFFNKAKPDYLGVANPYEGSILRRYGWQGNILNLGGFYPEVAHLLFEYKITPSITDLWQIEKLSQLCASLQEKIDIHIKLDLGMGRIGIQYHEIPELVSLFSQSPSLEIKGIFTHFPSSDNPSYPSNTRILENFESASFQIIDALKINRDNVILHTANSGAVLLNPDSHLDMVRPGICFYGYFADMAEKKKLSEQFPFKPCLKLVARPISLRGLKKDTSVSYGETFKIKHETETVGVIPLGYADGIPRQLSNNIIFDNHPLLGRVTMDQIVVGGMSGSFDEYVELLGVNSPPLEFWADQSGTITYQIMTNLGDRIQRKLV